MAGMKETIELVTVTLSNDAYQTPAVSQRAVFADRMPLFGTEFHAASASGYELAHIMKMHTFEYQGEKEAVYNGQRYEIYRSYERSDDWIELYLSTREHKDK